MALDGGERNGEATSGGTQALHGPLFFRCYSMVGPVRQAVASKIQYNTVIYEMFCMRGPMRVSEKSSKKIHVTETEKGGVTG